MSWSRKLIEPVALKDGRKLRTLNDAAALILSLPECRQRSEEWQCAVQLLVAAADAQGNLLMAQAQLGVALETEGLI
jgi:hypothetical protein